MKEQSVKCLLINDTINNTISGDRNAKRSCDFTDLYFGDSEGISSLCLVLSVTKVLILGLGVLKDLVKANIILFFF